MDKSYLVKTFGFPATLVHGDSLVLDRWLWLCRRLPHTRNGETLIDVGCGTGAFTIGAARRGYQSLGLSWDERDQTVARERAGLCGAKNAAFDILDVRNLDSRRDLLKKFDYAICLETIEHILDDRKLMRDIAACLKPGGRLLLTAPYYHYRAITPEDDGPFSKTEDGWHVRRGYTPAMLQELCSQCGLFFESTSYCGGMLSQQITKLQRILEKHSSMLAWCAVLPLRPLVPLLDLLHRLFRWPRYSIGLEAYKPRFD